MTIRKHFPAMKCSPFDGSPTAWMRPRVFRARRPGAITRARKYFTVLFQRISAKSAPGRAARPATLKLKKSCSLAEKQPVSGPRPVPSRLQEAFETGLRGTTFVRRP
jgi:hypothetical protein